MKNKNHPSETLPIDNSYQTGLPLLSRGVFIMKEIKLTQGKVAMVDDEDYQYLNGFKWYASKAGNVFYAMKAITVDGKRKTQYMHNVILNGKGIDHIDRNGCNNQKSNLRFCTQSENGMNRTKMENASSIFKGVCFNKSAKKWMVRIQINSKVIYLGLFASEIEAAKAYNAKAIELFGEFANLNNIN